MIWIAGTSIQRPRSISQNVIAVFVGCRTVTLPAAPCIYRYRRFTSVQMFHAHTHTLWDTLHATLETSSLAHTHTCFPCFLLRWIHLFLALTHIPDATLEPSLLAHTHTLAQNSHCEFWCGMHLTCKNTPIKPDRYWLMARGEKQCEEILSMSLLKATHPSKPSRYLSWQIATTVQWKKEKQEPIVRHAGSWLSRLPLTINWRLQVRLDGQSRYPTLWHSFVELGQSQSAQFPCL